MSGIVYNYLYFWDGFLNFVEWKFDYGYLLRKILVVIFYIYKNIKVEKVIIIGMFIFIIF